MKSPFKFLDSYTKEDREIFFGREKEIEELYRRVFRGKIMLVYGVSGTGKSSLINCGLSNKFRDEDWLPVNVRRGNNMLESMYAAIVAASLTPRSQYSPTETQFRKHVKSLYLDHYKPIYFIFDQFEELFIFGSREEKSLFVRVIKNLVDSDILCRFIFVMREEYMASVTEFEKLIPVFFSNRVRIENMDINNAIQAIKGPCNVFNINIEEGFSEALIENLSPGSLDIELTYLQVFLDKVYRLSMEESEAREGEVKNISFTLEQLSKIGNVSDLLGTFLNEQISLLADPDSALAVLKSFVSIKGTKKQMNLDEVKEYSQTLGKPISDPVLMEMLQSFVHLRILRDKDQHDRYELRHDSLATKIFEKISVVEKDILEIRQFIEDGYHNWQKREILFSDKDLKYIAPYESRLYLSKDLSGLIERSKDAQIKAKRKRINVAISLSLSVFLILFSITIWALREKQKSNQNYLIARANSYNFLSQKVVETDPTSALRLSEYASSIDSLNSEITQNIKRIYYDNNFYRIVPKLKCYVSAFAFSPDCKKILLADERDRNIRLLDLNGNLIQLFKGHESWSSSVAFSPDGNYILTGSMDKTARLWDLNGNVIMVFKGHLSGIRSVAFSPDGKYILTGSDDSTARLWDIDGNVLQIFKGHKDAIESVTFSPDQKSILTGSMDNTACLWNLSGKVIKVLKVNRWGVKKVAFSPDGNNIFTFSGDNEIRKWGKEGNSQIILSGKGYRFYSADFSYDGKYILTGNSDRTATLWDMNGNQILNLIGNKESIFYVALSRDSKMILTSWYGGEAYLWNIEGTRISILKNKPFASVRYSPDGKNILTASYDSTACLWDLDGNVLQIFKGHNDGVFNAVFSPDGNNILTGSFDNTARLWDLHGNQLQVFKGHKDFVTSVAFSPDGKTILTGSADKTARLWNLQGELVREFIGHSREIWAIAFSPDGRIIATNSGDGTTILWDLNGNKLRVLNNTGIEVNSIEFSRDGKTILTGGDNNTVKLWDLTGNVLQIFKGADNEISGVAFSPDGKTILAGSYDFIVHLWDLHGFELQQFRGHEGDIFGLAFSPDGNSFVSASKDGSFRITEIKKNLETFQKENDYQELSISQKLEYKIINYTDIIRSDDSTLMVDGAGFYYNSALQVSDSLSKSKNLEQAISIYKKLLSLDYEPKFVLGLTDAYFTKYDLTHQENELAIIKNLQSDLMTKIKKDDQFEVLRYYFAKCGKLDSIIIMLEFPQRLINLAERAINFYPAGSYERTEIGLQLSNLSFQLLSSKEFDLSLKLILLSVKSDEKNDYAYTNLPLAYIFNNQYEEAIKVYNEWKEKPWSKDSQFKTFKEVFLVDIADLENQGIIHPDFEKVKELLKK